MLFYFPKDMYFWKTVLYVILGLLTFDLFSQDVLENTVCQYRVPSHPRASDTNDLGKSDKASVLDTQGTLQRPYEMPCPFK